MNIRWEEEIAILFTADAEQLDAFMEKHESIFDRSDRKEFSRAARKESLEEVRSNVFSWVYGIAVDWREEDEEIVRLFGEYVDEELSAESTDSGLMVTYAGEKYPIPLKFSAEDRYITIRGLANLLKGKYEARLFRDSYFSDTHCFLLLPCSVWQSVEQRYGDQVEQIFQVIDDKLEFP